MVGAVPHLRSRVPHPKSGGYPIPDQGKVPHLRSGGGGTPIPGLGWGGPHPRSWLGGTLSQVGGTQGGTPQRPEMGHPPHLRCGTP